MADTKQIADVKEGDYVLISGGMSNESLTVVKRRLKKYFETITGLKFDYLGRQWGGNTWSMRYATVATDEYIAEARAKKRLGALRDNARELVGECKADALEEIIKIMKIFITGDK